MANKNTRRRETKKAKKDDKKIATGSPISSVPPVEVIRKRKKEVEE